GRRDCAAACFDAFQELPMVIGRALETKLIGPDLVHEDGAWMGVDSGPINPDPAFIAVPRDAALRLEPAADLEHHPIGVARPHLESRGRIPYAMRTQKFAGSFDLQRA